MFRAVLTLCLLALSSCACTAAFAADPPQMPVVVDSIGHRQSAQGAVILKADGTPFDAANPMPTAAKQETFTLAAGNTASSAATAYGGAYIFSQACSGYNSGSLTLRYRGPDGATMTALLTKTASDTSGGTLISLGSGAVMDVTLPAGSTGCNATLSRVP